MKILTFSLFQRKILGGMPRSLSTVWKAAGKTAALFYYLIMSIRSLSIDKNPDFYASLFCGWSMKLEDFSIFFSTLFFSQSLVDKNPRISYCSFTLSCRNPFKSSSSYILRSEFCVFKEIPVAYHVIHILIPEINYKRREWKGLLFHFQFCLIAPEDIAHFSNISVCERPNSFLLILILFPIVGISIFISFS